MDGRPPAGVGTAAGDGEGGAGSVVRQQGRLGSPDVSAVEGGEGPAASAAADAACADAIAVDPADRSPAEYGPPVLRLSAAGRFADGHGLCAGWLDDLRRSPRIAWRLFLRGLAQQYRHSALGLVLALAPVGLTVLVFVLGRRADYFSAEVGGVHSAFFGGFGVLLAQAFVESLGSMQRLFAGNQTLLKRQNLPIETALLAEIIDLVFLDLLRIVVIAILMAVFHVAPSPWMPLLPWTLVGVSLAGGAIGLLTAPFAALTSDLQVLSRVLMLVVAAVTPVFTMPAAGSEYERLQQANPLTWLFDGARAIAYGGPGSVAAGLAMPLVAVGLFLVAWLFCRIARPHVLERMIGGGA